MRPVTPPKSNLEERPASSYVFGYTFVSLNGCHRQGAIRLVYGGTDTPIIARKDAEYPRFQRVNDHRWVCYDGWWIWIPLLLRS